MAAKKRRKWQSEPEPSYELAIWVSEHVGLKDPLDHPWYVVPMPKPVGSSWEYACDCSRQPVRVYKFACDINNQTIYVGQCPKCFIVLWASSEHKKTKK